MKVGSAVYLMASNYSIIGLESSQGYLTGGGLVILEMEMEMDRFLMFRYWRLFLTTLTTDYFQLSRSSVELNLGA